MGTVFSQPPLESSVALHGSRVFGASFQNEVNQDQADINRVAVGGRFLPDFFESFLQLDRGFSAFEKARAHVLSRQEYFDLEQTLPEDKLWLAQLAALSLDGPEDQHLFADAVRGMYKYMDRTLDDVSRANVAKALYDTITNGPDTYNGDVEVYRQDELGTWELSETATFTDKNIYGIERLLGCQQIFQDGSGIRVEFMEGLVVGALKALKEELSNVSEKITWKAEAAAVPEEPGDPGDPGEQNPAESVPANLLATEAIQRGILSEIAKLSDEVDMLITLTNRINCRALISLFDAQGVPIGTNESLITMMQKSHSDFEENIKTFIASFLERIEKTVDYIVPLVEDIRHYAN